MIVFYLPQFQDPQHTFWLLIPVKSFHLLQINLGISLSSSIPQYQIWDKHSFTLTNPALSADKVLRPLLTVTRNIRALFYFLTIIKAAITPGIHPHRVRIKTSNKEPQPLSITASGGKIMQRITRQIDMVFCLN